ncbi:hypothetical protein TELCIR_25536 [Teladorsagia circumcincta]|uniref:Uncharacterized protein n=1 Tax=Teladorsagia circumcincta TaxID=45464 RepID=A0A2G9T5C1_TELCI|nr:hypothetical protein TELCIR_25536 [Teladorsagia circumcincta]
MEYEDLDDSDSDHRAEDDEDMEDL